MSINIIISFFFYFSNAKKYILRLKENPEKWMNDSIIKNKNMRKLNVKKNNLIFIDTELNPINFLDDNVLSIEEDKVMPPLYKCQETWGLDRINQVNLPLDAVYLTEDCRGNDVDVYILDTGIKISHSVFEKTPIWDGHFGNDNINTDCHGHGTHVGGTVSGKLTGVAPDVNLFSIKISSWCEGEEYPGSAYCSDMIEAIEYVHDKMKLTGHKSVINLSYGICPSVTFAINEFMEEGGLFALAAGNDGENQCSNLEYSNFNKNGGMIVGASKDNDEVTYFSNHGDCVDIYAPGSSILSGDYSDLDECSYKSGTSMASPHVAGAMAVLWSRNPSLTNIQIRTLLMNETLTNKLNFKSFSGNNNLLFLNITSKSYFLFNSYIFFFILVITLYI